MKLSHSKLSTILSCPMTYYLTYVQGISQKVEKPALAIGSAVHWGIEHSTEDLSEYFKDNGTFKQGDNFTRDQLLSEAMVHGFLKHKDEIYESILTDPVTGEKLELLDESKEIFLTGKLPSYKYDQPHDFVGIIDLLLLTNKGFIIIDYKTSTYTPDWDGYLDQLYRYIFELRTNFPNVPIVKIGIINIRKTGIRQKKNETEFEFLQRMQFEYDVNDEEYVVYHEFLPEEIDSKKLDEYIDNLSKMSDTAQMIVDNKMWFINYGAANGQYGKSPFWDIFYQTPGAEVLYNISDYVWDKDDKKFNTSRDAVDIDMLVIAHNNVLNKYEIFKDELEKCNLDKDNFFDLLSKQYITNKNLLETYWTTYAKEKEVENASK